MKKFAELLESKAKVQKPMHSAEKDAKLKAIHEMRKMASDEMAMPLKNLKKVTVASDSSEGVKKGLEKAKEMMGQHEPMMEKAEEEAGEDLDKDMEMGEEHAEGMGEVDPEDMSPEELQEMIQELQKVLAAKK